MMPGENRLVPEDLRPKRIRTSPENALIPTLRTAVR
jgi:hypothetical protein